MKIKVLLLSLAMVLAVGVKAQKQDVTKFMGTPVEGTKTAMIQKLKAKGFTYNAKMDRLEGEFNGRKSYISVVTNRNKVYRIVVHDAYYTNESSIKIRYNNLCEQFYENEKYVPVDMVGNFQIDDNESISYEMSVNKKRFEAAYYQVSDADKDTTGQSAFMWNTIRENYTDVAFYALSDEEQKTEYAKAWMWWYYNNVLPKASHKSVWFMIAEYYGEYGIVLYYDNKYNESNGEDL